MSAITESLPAALTTASEIVVPAGSCVFAQGQRAESYLFVVAGCVRVFARSSEGREVVLYRVRPGEMCTLTTSCMLAQARYPAEAVTETEVRARVLDGASFEQALNGSADFRRFVFRSLGERLAEVMLRMEQLVLEPVQVRLIRGLLGHADQGGIARVTHEQLANDVGTARGVVSRHLKALEQEGLISTERGRVRLLRRERLRDLS